MQIIGAGMAGLLATNMMHRHSPWISEKQSSLPHNHSAVLRFGSDKVGEVLGIPFRKVKLIKTYLPYANRVADNLLYSYKCTGVYRSDRSIATEVFAADRWIAPPNLIQRMAANAHHIKFDYELTMEGIKHWHHRNEPIISTIPMPSMMRLLGYERQIEFKHISGANIIAKIANCDAFISLYIPDPNYGFSRVSITGDEMILEYPFPAVVYEFNDAEIGEQVEKACEILSIDQSKVLSVEFKQQTYAKIQPIDDGERKRFLSWATDNFGIFALGRYATWRPGLLLDDLVHDVRLIEKWINEGNYAMRFHR